MGIQNFPAALQSIIQQGFLERKFEQALRAKLAYRAIADREPFSVRIGESLTKTRAGLRPAATAPLVASGNTNFDNGLTPSAFAVEQYTVKINQYGDTADLNVVADRVAIASQFLQNAITLGEQAARTLDTLAANTLFNTYMGGNTRVITTLGSPGTAVRVDDVRGFQTVFNSAGQQVPVGTSNTMTVTVNGTAYTLTGVTADGNAPAALPPELSTMAFSGSGSNSSTAPNGYSGSLTFSSNVTVANGTAANAVVGALAPSVIRPNGRVTTAALTTGDTLLMISNVLQATTTLRMNNVPDVNGAFNFYLDPQQLQGLFGDTAFQTLFRGAYQSREYRQGEVFELMGVRFIPTNLAPQQTLSGQSIRRGLICGKGALVEGDFAGEAAEDTDTPLADIRQVDGVRLITRAPMDRLQQIIAQSWRWIGGFTTPTDTTANPTVIPTASSSAWKRAVLVESL